MLRQQMLPTTRIHLNIISDPDHVINIIPAHAKLEVAIRALDLAEFDRVTKAVKRCAQAAAESARCKVEDEWTAPYLSQFLRQRSLHTPDHDNLASLALNNNLALANEYALQMEHSQQEDIPWRADPAASTDFGNVSQEVPSIHPHFEIPSSSDGQNHTKKFTESAASITAHTATIKACKGLAAVAWRVFTDEGFLNDVRTSFRKNAQKPRINGE